MGMLRHRLSELFHPDNALKKPWAVLELMDSVTPMQNGYKMLPDQNGGVQSSADVNQRGAISYNQPVRREPGSNDLCI